jgi:serine phosphatase RsbU (regulator of sigma subunit)
VLSQGDALVIYSDGLVDARPDLELTPQQLNTLIADANSAAEIRARLMALVVDHNELTDDLTVLILFRYV